MARARVAKPLPLLLDRTLNKLALSSLTYDDAVAMRITEVTTEEATVLRLPAKVAGFKLPYFNISGEQTKFFRVRYMEDTRSGFSKAANAKAMRYGQVPNTLNELYLPPFVDWAAIAGNIETPLVITEGELKAACASKHGLPTIGLGGVWCFQSNKHGVPLLNDFDAFEWDKRTVYIVFDSDAIGNPDILLAEKRLAERLLEKGAIVNIGRIPSDSATKKVGLDDFIVAHGIDVLMTDVLNEAYPFEESEVLHTLNARCLYIRDPGLVWDRQNRQRILPNAFINHAFSNIHYWERRMNSKGGITQTKHPAAKAWIAWEHRSECIGLDFAPGEDEITKLGRLNTWTGWGVPEPVRGDVEQWHILMQHLFGNDSVSRKWFESWCAYPLQHPGAKMATAALLWGVVHGSGKTLVGHTLMKIYGHHAAEIHDSDLDDERREWALDKQFILGDDIVAKGDRRLMRQIMTSITQKQLRMNPKYIPSYFIKDTLNYLFTSNEPDAFYMDDQDRRFWIHEVMEGKFTLYKAYTAWMNSPAGIAALWHYLLSFNIKDFDPQAPAPDTAGKLEMKALGKSELGAWVADFRENFEPILKRANMHGDLLTAAELHALYDPTGGKRTTVNALARELKRAGFIPPGNGTKLKLPDGSCRGVYVVRNHAKWRYATWAEACRHYSEARAYIGPVTRKF